MGETVWVELSEPRKLTPREQSLLDALTAQIPGDALAAQVRSTEVVAVCRCGCPSLRLRSDGPAVPVEVIGQLSSTGRDDYLGVEACVDTPGSPGVQLVVHVLAGLLVELGIFAGEGFAVAVPAAADLHDVQMV